MKIPRMSLAVILSSIITIGLFSMMVSMVFTDVKFIDDGDVLPISFGPVAAPKEIDPAPRKKIPPKPEPEELPPPPSLKITEIDIQPIDIDIKFDPLSPFPPGPGMGISGGKLPPGHSGNEEAIVMLAVSPQYPGDAALDGIEGWVKLEFTITKTGTVKNPRVIEAKPPRIFNKSALHSILRWKFKPRMIKGKAVERTARQTIAFSLKEA